MVYKNIVRVVMMINIAYLCLSQLIAELKTALSQNKILSIEELIPIIIQECGKLVPCAYTQACRIFFR
jgi:hypothetical protein